MNPLFIVQGDYEHIKVKFNGATVTSFYFSCGALGFSKEFTTQESGEWYITLTSLETKEFKAGKFTFDITATINGQTITGLYNGSLIILPKDNPTIPVN